MKRSWVIKFLIESVVFYSFYFAFIVLPHLIIYWYGIPAGLKIDPEVINGLLAASSILFGVLTLVVAKQHEYLHGIEIRVYAMVVINVALFVFVALNIFYYAIGSDRSGVTALSWAMSSFTSNVFGALYALSRLRRMK